jgi:hypothetical protein
MGGIPEIATPNNPLFSSLGRYVPRTYLFFFKKGFSAKCCCYPITVTPINCNQKSRFTLIFIMMVILLPNHHLVDISPMLRGEGEGLHYLVEGESVGDDTFN